MRVYLLVAALLLWVSRAAKAAQSGDVVTATGEVEQSGGIDLSGAIYQVENMFAGKKISGAGLEALKAREGFRASVYLDTAGKKTIGYGHLIGAFESFGSFISEQVAAELLASDASTAEDAVAALVTVPISQDQFDALVSFTFNVGVSAFRNSTLLKLLNAGQYDAAREQLGQWVYVTRGGVKVADSGLLNRRGSEMMQFA